MKETRLKLKTATKNDCKDIWLWRNHPEARKNFFNPNPIPWKEHREWFYSKIKDEDTKIYIAVLKKSKIGVIRFEIKGSLVKVSINLNPDFFGKGLGHKVIRLGTEKFLKETKARKEIIAEIKRDNIVSRKAFVKAGYRRAERKADILVYKRNGKQVCLVGKRIYLRPLCKKYIDNRYLAWLNDREVTRFMETGIARVTRRDLEAFCEKIIKSETDEMFVIVTKRNGTHIGNIKLGDINWRHGYGNLGIMIGEKRYWGKGYTQEACRLLLDRAFNTLYLNKVTLGVYGSHVTAIKAYRKAGFKIEGRIKNLLSYEGRYVDKVIMGLSSREFNRLNASSKI